MGWFSEWLGKRKHKIDIKKALDNRKETVVKANDLVKTEHYCCDKLRQKQLRKREIKKKLYKKHNKPK